MIRCTTCAHEIDESRSSCPECGAPVATTTNGHLTQTVAMPQSEGTAAVPVRTGSVSRTASRLIDTSNPDQGRFLPGTLLAGRYRIISLLGQGGMGEVYRATDLTLAQSVALKFLPEAAAGNERLLERFNNEVRIARQVSHPNVCRVYDIGQADGQPFISMEYVDGEDLASLLLRIGRLPGDKALEIARKVCAGLSAAHDRGVIHRDLKPQNIMLNRRGEVLIMDFGLAAVTDQLGGPEARNGTPAYMAPEQLRGVEVTAKSDIYALGLVLYELFTGKRVFEATTIQELIRQQESHQITSVSTIAADVDPAVEKVIRRCLDPSPARRPASPLAIAAALPGGDPLAAALAAGETPSPELVAASGAREGMAMKYLLPSFLLMLVAIIGSPILTRSHGVVRLSPVDYPPDVLAQKARDIASSFGYTAKPADSWYELFYPNDYTEYLKSHASGVKDWVAVFNAESPIRLKYRQSPAALTAEPDGRVDDQNPPGVISGMIRIETDSRGRLRRFEAVPEQVDSPGAEAKPFDPEMVFRAANLDAKTFQEVRPRYTPLVAFDTRRAWKGKYPGLDNVDLTVEASSWRGRITDVMFIWPWTKPDRVAVDDSKTSDYIRITLSLSLTAAGLIASLWLARRNMRLGRGDRKGAFRVAAFKFIAGFLIWCCYCHHVPKLNEIGLFLEQAGGWLLAATLTWLLYIALEPAVRSRWPHSLVTWNRLLAGRFEDPRFNSHLLMGAGMGIVLVYMILVRTLTLGHVIVPDTEPLRQLMGTRAWIGDNIQMLSAALTSGLILFFLLFGLKVLLRNNMVAALLGAVLLTANQGSVWRSSDVLVDAILFVILYWAILMAFVRLGLLASVVAIFFINTIEKIFIGSDWTAWYNAPAISVLFLLIGILSFAFWKAQGAPAARETEMFGESAIRHA